MAAKTGVFNRATGTTMGDWVKAPHVGVKAFVRPVSGGDVEYGRWLYRQGYSFVACTTEEMRQGWIKAERDG